MRRKVWCVAYKDPFWFAEGHAVFYYRCNTEWATSKQHPDIALFCSEEHAKHRIECIKDHSIQAEIKRCCFPDFDPSRLFVIEMIRDVRDYLSSY